MNIGKATTRYEAWLGTRVALIQRDVDFKHKQMRLAEFPFLRATYYRWAQTWRQAAGDAARAPKALSVGDLHVENFGTWRDIEGRLVWGVNDFDEAWPLPYTSDLIRLATSAVMAISGDYQAMCAAILQGYSKALTAGGRPFVLAEHNSGLRGLATARLHNPQKYWDKLQELPTVKGKTPDGALKALARLMPEKGLASRVVHRVAGLGSLGRPRYLALAEWRGGLVAREAKAVAPSASVWAEEIEGRAPILYQQVLNQAVRCPDPFVRLKSRWIVRRLAPDCSRIELGDLPSERHELSLLNAMGWETANIHLATARPAILAKDLKRRPAGWLLAAAHAGRKAVAADWHAWQKG